jgi:hypothetical protein
MAAAARSADTAGDRRVEPGLFAALKEAGRQWMAHKSAKAGASLAYYSIFSIGPLIVVVISIAGLVFQREGVQQEVVAAVEGLVGDKGAEAVGGMLNAAGKPSEGLFATVIGTAALLFAAIGVVVQLKEALNTVWDAKPPKRSGLWGFVREYVLSFAGVLGARLPAPGLDAADRGAGGNRQARRRRAAQADDAGPRLRRLLPEHQRDVCAAVQVDARCRSRMARRAAGRGRDRGAVRDRRVRDRVLHRQAGARIDVRRPRPRSSWC